MKKHLLLVAAILAASSAAKAAERTKPVYAGGFQPLNTTDTVFIYNTESKMFLTEGNDWGTHATVGDEGIPFAIKEHKENGAWDGKTYVIRDYSTVKKAWKNVFVTDGGGIFVDASDSAADTCFTFTDMGNSTYRIAGADCNPTWNATGDMADYMFGHYTEYNNSRDNIQTGTGVIYDYFGIDHSYGEGQFLTSWAFVSQADYATYLADVNVFKASESLKPMLEQANMFGIDAKDEQAVYDSQASSEEDIRSAIESLNAKFLAYYEQSVTPDSPKDLTDMLKNPDCNATDGWTNAINASTWGTQTWIDDSWTGFDGTTLNIWSASLNGKAYQKLTGLPNGIYISSIAVYSEKMDGFVYANENRKVVAGGAAGAVYTITTEVTDGELEIGFGQDNEGTNWVAMDNATVSYYGSGVEAYRYWLNGLLESAPSFDDVIVQDSLVEEYKGVLASVNTVATKDEILGIIPSYEAILNEISGNITAYENLTWAKNTAEGLQSQNLNEYYGNMLGDFISENVNDALSSHTAGTEEVIEIYRNLLNMVQEAQNYLWNIETLENELITAQGIYEEYGSVCKLSDAEAYLEFIEDYGKMDKSEFTNDKVLEILKSLYAIEFNLQVPADPASDTNPIDYTAKIKFPSFDNGAEGWTNEGFGTCGLNDWNSFADGEIIDKQYLNLWNEKAAEVNQTITGLPNGAYTFQVSAFADAEGFEVFANDNRASVIAGQNAEGIPCYYGNIYTVDVIVTDGTLKIGGRIATDATIWAMLDNAKLTYYGTESQIMTGIAAASGSCASVSAVFSTSGVRTSDMQKGINIVRMSDGSVRKVYVK